MCRFVIVSFFAGRVPNPGHVRGPAAGRTAEADLGAGLALAGRIRPADHIHVPDRGPVHPAAVPTTPPRRPTGTPTNLKFPMLGPFFNTYCNTFYTYLHYALVSFYFLSYFV